MITEIKALVDRLTLPPDEEFLAAVRAYFAATARPGTGRALLATLVEHGLQRDGDVERRLGAHIASTAAAAAERVEARV